MGCACGSAVPAHSLWPSALLLQVHNFSSLEGWKLWPFSKGTRGFQDRPACFLFKAHTQHGSILTLRSISPQQGQACFPCPGWVMSKPCCTEQRHWGQTCHPCFPPGWLPCWAQGHHTQLCRECMCCSTGSSLGCPRRQWRETPSLCWALHCGHGRRF